jgi:protein-S-isoprenylcysteine O-methyltransferase Ste14
MANFKSSDPWSTVVIVLTVGLFVLALFLKGFTHGLLLEAGVLLVSVKLILMTQKNAKTEENLERRLTRIEELLQAGRDSRSPLREQ